ncbi:uncharacterized protein METZ01_LOCUS432698, partial [marine metagenome]
FTKGEQGKRFGNARARLGHGRREDGICRMLTYLQNLEDLFGPLRLFQFISVRAMMAGLTSLFLGFYLGPRLFALLRSLDARQAFRSEEEVGALAGLHKEKASTPTMGGLLIFVSVVLSSLLWADPNIYVVTALAVYALLTVVGFSDDYLKVAKRNSKGLSGKMKLLGQLIAVAVALYLLIGPAGEMLTGIKGNASGSAAKMSQLWIPFYKQVLWQTMPLTAIFVLFFFTLCGSSNAINLTDGLDGLAIGCTVTVALAYGLMAYAS